ncbi:hypothetical protein [Guptibacillus algicola]|uniref:hypothetical protein n=1 Tax=Guptibacillus algicola TaxID=225844 RepID=UPI001CD6405D|nr:hypothetical protein [Alkalihalobacillus algicola]MCA0988892.1 hypothetical protein [Alkalihalobacillus algicola]
MKRIDALNQMHVVTNQIVKSLDELKPSMDENGPEDLDGINNMITRREETIQLLDKAMKQEGTVWSEEEQVMLQQLNKLEGKIQPRLSDLYAAFSEQMRRLQQGKTAASKYNTGQAYTDGAFFDKRK